MGGWGEGGYFGQNRTFKIRSYLELKLPSLEDNLTGIGQHNLTRRYMWNFVISRIFQKVPGLAFDSKTVKTDQKAI